MAEQRKPHPGRSMGVVRAGSVREHLREIEREAMEREEGGGDPYGSWSREGLRSWVQREREMDRSRGKRREELELGRGRAKQTVIVKKTTAKTRGEAAKVAKKYADRVYTSRGEKNVWRFRQRPPQCFVPGTMRTWCKPGNGVCIVYGTLKEDAKKRKSCR